MHRPEVLGTVERDRLELIAESNERIVRTQPCTKATASRRARVAAAGTRHAAGPARCSARRTRPRRSDDSPTSSRGRAHARSTKRGNTRRRRERLARRAGGIRTRTCTGRAKAREPVERRPGAHAARFCARAARRCAGSPGAAAARATAANKSPRPGQPSIAPRPISRNSKRSRHAMSCARLVPGSIEALPYKLGERPAAGGPVA